jgi:hypothetical protein
MRRVVLLGERGGQRARPNRRCDVGRGRPLLDPPLPTHAPLDLDLVDSVTAAMAIGANKSSAGAVGSDFALANAQAVGVATAAQSPPMVPRESGRRPAPGVRRAEVEPSDDPAMHHERRPPGSSVLAAHWGADASDTEMLVAPGKRGHADQRVIELAAA